MKILIVDDSKAMRLIVRRALRQAGLADDGIHEANNGAEALAQIRAASPDLVLSDWNMPEMSGIDLLSTLAKEGRKVPCERQTMGMSELLGQGQRLPTPSYSLHWIAQTP